jgi:hypothetical protein
MGNNSSNIDLLKTLFPYLSTPVSGALIFLVLTPSISFSPYFPVILFGGFVTFLVSLLSTMAKKLGWLKFFYHIAGTAVAGFVVVSWARYQSISVSIIVEILVLISIFIALIITRKKIAKNYKKKYLPIVLAGLIIAGLMPILTIIQNIGQPPLLIVSPSEHFLTFVKQDNATSPQLFEKEVSVNIAGVYANIYNIRLKLESLNPLIISFLDNKENGPVEIPFLERGQTQNTTMRIELSSQLQSGTYNVTLNYVYSDGLTRPYQGSNYVLVSVFDGSTIPVSTPLYIYSVAFLVSFAFEILIAIFLRRRRRRIPS